MHVINGVVTECPTCLTPWSRHPPEGYTMTIQKVRGVQYIQLHTPYCPDGFRVVEIPDVE